LNRIIDINCENELIFEYVTEYNVFNHLYNKGFYFDPAADASSANGGIKFSVKDIFNNSILRSLAGEDISEQTLYTMAEQGTEVTAEREVVVMGDSFTAGVIPGGGTAYYTVLANLLTGAGYTNINTHVEGIQGWKWSTYISNHESNPFWNPLTAQLDFNYYCTNEGISQINMMTCMLGINDVRSNPYDLDQIIADMKIFFDALLSDFPNCKILILQQPNGAYHSNFRTEYKRMFELHKQEILNFDNGLYNSNIKLIPLHALINNSCYESGSLVINSMGEEIDIFDDYIHPNDNAHEVMGNIIYSSILYYLN